MYRRRIFFDLFTGDVLYSYIDIREDKPDGSADV